VAAVALVVAAPAGDVHARNLGRSGRVVPPEVVERQLAQLARLGATPGTIAGSLIAEGFGAVHVIGSAAELRELVVERHPRHATD
jgi:hypothetical protein